MTPGDAGGQRHDLPAKPRALDHRWIVALSPRGDPHGAANDGAGGDRVTGPWRKPRKWNIPLIYAPKIPGVIDGTIRQTIRVGRKFRVGDLVSFHGWEGRPYRSKWSFRTPYFTLTMARAIRIVPGGIVVPPRPLHEEYYAWRELDDLAARDGIEPPTGEALRDVLLGMHKIPADGIEAQILRWRWWTV